MPNSSWYCDSRERHDISCSLLKINQIVNDYMLYIIDALQQIILCIKVVYHRCRGLIFEIKIKGVKVIGVQFFLAV